MVNNTAINTEAEVFDDECPDTDYGNDTEHQQDGDFDWSTSKQGWILSSFFYGYVLTQVGGTLSPKRLSRHVEQLIFFRSLFDRNFQGR